MSVKSKLTTAATLLSKGQFFKRLWEQYLFQIVYLPVAMWEIFDTKGRFFNSYWKTELAFNIARGYIKPMQVHSEIRPLMTFVEAQQPKVFVEIGTARGGTLFLFCSVLPRDATIVSIDMPGGKYGGYYKFRRLLYRTFARGNQKIHFIQADSHLVSTRQKVEKILDGRVIDFMFIDGDHTYDGVKKDVELYEPIVKGYITFHDICAKRPWTEWYKNMKFIPDYWQEVKKEDSIEIVDDWNQRNEKGDLWAGIGILKV